MNQGSLSVAIVLPILFQIYHWLSAQVPALPGTRELSVDSAPSQD